MTPSSSQGFGGEKPRLTQVGHGVISIYGTRGHDPMESKKYGKHSRRRQQIVTDEEEIKQELGENDEELEIPEVPKAK